MLPGEGTGCESSSAVVAYEVQGRDVWARNNGPGKEIG